jgi:peptidyl-prolyl cis-trans isomerase C
MKRIRIAIPLFAAAAGIVLAAPLAPDTPLIEDNGVKVTILDFEAAISRVPEDKRAEVRTSTERIATLLDTAYVARQVAARARAAGLDKDPVVQKRLEQAQDAVLAELYVAELDRTAKLPNLDQRARELYLANLDSYKTENEIYVQHILVGLVGRTREMALERAKELRAELDSGKEDFLAMAKRLSEDPDKRRNGGDLGWFSVRSLEPEMVQAASTMKKGEVSQPVQTRHGYHIIKFIDRRASTTTPFEAVKGRIMAAERDRLLRERRDLLLKEIRDSKTVIVYRANMETLKQEDIRARPPEARKN